MGFFERPSPRETECAERDSAPALVPMLRRHALGIACVIASVGVFYGADILTGLRSSAVTSGVLGGSGVRSEVSIRRDERDVPHVVARDERDAFFAEGYVEASDRLFQMDLTRRYALGELAEVLGAKALPIDEEQRYAAIGPIADRQLQHLDARDRAALDAYTAGVNAAMRTQPLPPEFRLLLFRPRAWTPRDSLAVAAVATLELSDSWHRIFARDIAWRNDTPRLYNQLYPLSDPAYDVSIDAIASSGRARPNPMRVAMHLAGAAPREPTHSRPGSNVWAAGGDRTDTGRALLANDPHLDLTIPGIWYLIDVRAPGLHVAGAAIPGVPGVVLGHDDRVAWGASNAQTATASVYDSGRLDPASWTRERFHVRFAADVVRSYYRTPRYFGVPNDDDRRDLSLVRWPPYADSHSTISTFLALDRSSSVRDAFAILSRYRGSPQNFVVADTSGAVGYHLAGSIPDDPAWGRYVHRSRDLHDAAGIVPFDALPARAPSRAHVVVSANNKMYGPDYPRRLSPAFEPPYRAYRIAQLLAARSRYDVAYFARMQMDALSPVDLEIARDIVRILRSSRSDSVGSRRVAVLAAWDGRFTPQSKAATLEHALRADLQNQLPSTSALLAELRDEKQPSFDLLSGVHDAFSLATDSRAWGSAGSVPVEHPLAPLHFGFLDGPTLEGRGDEYTIHLQEPGFSQGFRAVWDVGNWDAGGIVVPSGESGEPGSSHYRDLTNAWEAGTLESLPFTPAAVSKATRATLVLTP
jgi:penicillin amidase